MSLSIQTFSSRQGLRAAASMIALGVGAGMATASFAQSVQDREEPAAVADVVVTAALAPAAGAALKMPLKLSEIPQTVSIIDRERIEQQALVSLDDVMSNAPGVTVQPGTRLRTAYYARGFSIDTLNFDGIPTSGWNEAVNTEDMAIYQRVELLRGASGLLQGSGNPSGTINLVRKRPGRDFAAQGAVSGGRWNNWRVEGDVGGPLAADGDLRGRLAAVYEDRDFYYDTAHRQKGLIYGTAEWNVTPRTVLAATVKWQDVQDDGAYMGVPRYSDGGVIDLPRRFYPGAGWDRRTWNNTQSFLELRHSFAGDWEGKISISRIDGDSDLTYASAFGAVNRATGKGPILYGGTYDFTNEETDLDAYLSGTVGAFGRRHEIVLGANYWDGKTHQTAYNLAGLMGPVDVFAWDPAAAPRPTGKTYAGEQTTTTEQYGGYGVARLHLTDPLTLVLGGRLSWWETTTDRRATIGGPLTPTGGYKIDGEFTPYAGLVWALDDAISLYASYTSIFTPQNSLTWDGKVIDPMTGANVEAGVKGEWLGGRLNGSLAAFRILQENRAQLDPDHPCAPGMTCAYVAEGEVESLGLDAELTGRIRPDWTVQAGYTYVETEYKRDRTAAGTPSGNEGQPFSRFTPRHQFKLWTHYTGLMDGRLSLGGGVIAQSKAQAVAGAVVMEQGAYAIVNARAAYRLNPRAELSLNVNNLFDKTYFTTLGGTSWNNWYGEPRNVLITLRASY